MLTAFVEVILGWGYSIQIDNSGIIVEEYQAGDSFYDSGTFGTGQASIEQLTIWATSTAKDMLFEHGAIEPYNLEIQTYESLEIWEEG